MVTFCYSYSRGVWFNTIFLSTAIAIASLAQAAENSQKNASGTEQSSQSENKVPSLKVGMTYAQAKARIPQRTLPEFWIGDVQGLADRFHELSKAQVSVIARSPGGRPLHLVASGTPEIMPARANFNSAIGGQEPAAYCDKAARRKPVLLLIGPVHGQEVEGLTGLVNLINILETGHDLRGKNQSQLQALGQQCRLLIIPEGNPDGIARFEPRTLQGMTDLDLRFWGQGTWSNHSYCDWPQCKQKHPMVGPMVGFLGCYFNDKGVNPMHDEFFDPMSTEAPAILKVARTNAPDFAVSLHSHESKPDLLRPAYVPMEEQEIIRNLALSCYALLDQRNLPHTEPFKPRAESGRHPEPFNLSSALYHISGAHSFTFECPHGVTDANACQVSLDQILDIQLTLYEAMMRFALEQKQQ